LLENWLRAQGLLTAGNAAAGGAPQAKN